MTSSYNLCCADNPVNASFSCSLNGAEFLSQFTVDFFVSAENFYAGETFSVSASTRSNWHYVEKLAQNIVITVKNCLYAIKRRVMSFIAGAIRRMQRCGVLPSVYKQYSRLRL